MAIHYNILDRKQARWCLQKCNVDGASRRLSSLSVNAASRPLALSPCALCELPHSLPRRQTQTSITCLAGRRKRNICHLAHFRHVYAFLLSLRPFGSFPLPSVQVCHPPPVVHKLPRRQTQTAHFGIRHIPPIVSNNLTLAALSHCLRAWNNFLSVGRPPPVVGWNCLAGRR